MKLKRRVLGNLCLLFFAIEFENYVHDIFWRVAAFCNFLRVLYHAQN